ncbi:MAG: asparagine synthase (glutamine-hydrolyzing) [Verrucomicrobia bacterium]|nr:asparagine synthase (glutamine-hydrolyzing) [Verrucomicrobiota bacterium]
MCGISGFNWTDEALVRSMNDAQRHRGPDDDGVFTDVHVSLGHRRLSILDLSSAGHQPMAYDNDTLWIVHNGEIYNFQELRTELDQLGHRFRSGTDTEVILAAYHAWGADCVRRFSGMWAFCIYDPARRSLFCSRDRFGIKPFYYFHEGKRFAFASEIKALRLHDRPRVLNRHAAFDFLVNGMVDHGVETFYEGIHQLRPAHNLHVDLDAGTMNLACYYEPPSGRSDPAELADRLSAAVNSHMISDVPVGSCLSGGLDSSAIVALASRGRDDFHTFSAEYGADTGSHNEKKHIDRMAEHLPLHRHTIEPSAESLAHDLEAVLEVQDEPMLSSSPYAQYKVFELARQHGIPVLLDGQGADETLWGYHSAQGIFLGLLLRALHVRTFLRNVPAHWSRRALPYLAFPMLPRGWIERYYRRKPLYFALRERARDYPLYVPRIESMADYTRLWMTETNLPQLLRYEDRNSMAHSIESRVPFLDHDFVEYVTQLPDHEKLGTKATKQIMRTAMSPILPEEIVWRRDKVGFETPGARWMKHPAMQAMCEKVFSKEARLLAVLDPDRLQSIKSSLDAGSVFRLLCLELAMRDMSASSPS